MKSFKFWFFIFIVVGLFALIAFGISRTVDKTVIIVLVTSLTAIVTIVGTVYVNQSLANENANNQRSAEIRKMKQDYYHKFTESFLLRITYIESQDSSEFKEADIFFCKEKNRLPLYASQEIVEFIEQVATKSTFEAKNTFTTLYKLIRKDLLDEKFLNFSNLKEIQLTLPAPTTRVGSKPTVNKKQR